MVRYISQLKELDNNIQKLIHIKALLEWDQETYMPVRAVADRAEQIAIIEGIIHEKTISPEFGEILEKLGANATNPTGTLSISDEHKGYVRAIYRRYSRHNKLPLNFITELARQSSLAQSKWLNARKINDFTIFKSNLKSIVNLLRQKAILIGYDGHIYDAIMDEYEPWMKTADLDHIFRDFHRQLSRLYNRIIETGRHPERDFLKTTFPVEQQQAFSQSILQKIGFDFQRGRVDKAPHPFTTCLGSSDIRITINYNPLLPCFGLLGMLHEGGHGLYELGYTADIQGTILANAASVGIHESQSRLWENIIGKGFPFWQAMYPEFQALFREQIADVDVDSFYKAINTVEPSPIRVEADEVTYNLHILLRYNLEKRLISGDLDVDDLPAAWREESKNLLGLEPADDNEGILQDIHWAVGAMGYFPTYSLGNLYSAQFYKTLQQDLPDINSQVAKGNLFPVFNWLREKIHIYGSIYTAEELCKKVTGASLDPKFYMQYLEEKFKTIYEF